MGASRHRPGTLAVAHLTPLTYLAPRIAYHSCPGAAKFYGILVAFWKNGSQPRHSPGHSPGLLINEVHHAEVPISAYQFASPWHFHNARSGRHYQTR